MGRHSACLWRLQAVQATLHHLVKTSNSATINTGTSATATSTPRPPILVAVDFLPLKTSLTLSLERRKIYSFFRKGDHHRLQGITVLGEMNYELCLFAGIKVS